jgi:hypothetical protein
MSDADTQIQASVVITSDTSGAQRATAALNGVNAAGGKAAEGTTAAAKSTRFSSEEFTRAARSASVLNGSMEGLGAMAHQLATKFAGIASALPVIGLMIAAFTAWKAAITAVVDAHKRNEEAMRSIKVGNLDSQIKSLADSYRRLTDEIDNTTTSQKLMLEAQQAIAESTARQEKANIDLAEISAMENEKDPLKQAVLKAGFEKQRVAVDSRLAGQSEETKMNNMWVDFTQATNQRDEAKRQLPVVSNAAAQANRLYTDVVKQRDAKMNQAESLFLGDAAFKKITDEYDPKIKELQQKADDALLVAKVAREKLDAAERLLPALKMKLDAQQMALGARQTETTVSGRRASAAETSANTAVTVADLAAQKSAAEAQLPQYQQQAAEAQDYLSTIPDRISSGTYSQADQSAMLQALTSAQEQTALLQSFITRIGAEMAKQNEILRTLPTR